MSCRARQLALLAACCAGSSAMAAAADPPPDTLADIVVTAQRVESTVLRTDASLTALSGEELQAKGVMDLRDLYTSVPNLVYSQTGVTPQVYIRGIGFENLVLGGDPGVAYNIDGVYLGRPSAALQAYSDIERVEVLRGPQGTLYGRNATGGAINIITHRPEADVDFSGDVLYGNYNQVVMHGVANAPLVGDTVLARVSAYSMYHDGFVDNLLDGTRIDNQDTRGARAQLLFLPTSELTIRLIAELNSDTGTGPAYKDQGDLPAYPYEGAAPNPADPWQINQDTANKLDNRWTGYTADIEWSPGPVSLTSISSYQGSQVHQWADGDGSSLHLITLNTLDTNKQYTQELRLTSSTGGPLSWLVGAYYLHESNDRNSDISYTVPGLFDNLPISFLGGVTTRSYAGFGNLSYKVTENLKLSAGARYSSDKKTGSEYQNTGGAVTCEGAPNGKWSDVTWRTSVDYSLGASSLLYGSASTGFKSGGLNIGGCQPSFGPEKVLTYEIGHKIRTEGGRLQLTTAVFDSRYKDLQVYQPTPPPLNTDYIENAAEATIYGLELEYAAVPSSYLRLDGSISFLHATFGEYETVDQTQAQLGLQDLRGRTLSRAPRFQGNAGAQFNIPAWRQGMVHLRSDLYYQSYTYYRAFNLPSDRVGGYAKLDASATYEDSSGHWWVKAFGKNLTDKAYITNIQPGFSTNFITVDPPRTFGVQVGYRYR